MNSPTEGPLKGVTLASFDYSKLPDGPNHFVSVPEAFHPFIVHIALVWGSLEQKFNHLLGRMVAYNGTQYREGWPRFSFEQRAGMFVDEANKAFMYHPWLLIHLLWVTKRATDLQVKRNLLLHGDISLRIQSDNGQLSTSIIVKGRQKKRDFELLFTLKDIEDLAYSLGNVAGWILLLSTAHDSEIIGFISWRERLHLQAVLACSPPDP